MSRSVRKAILDVRKEEWPLAIRMSAYFFLVITSFWILKPLKKTLFVLHYEAQPFLLGPFAWNGAQAELVAKVANMFVALAAVFVFSRLSLRFRRDRLSVIVTTFFLAVYAVFFATLSHPEPGVVAIWCFYLFGDLLSTLMVATFFAFLNDSLDPDGAKRLLGVIGLGGVAGGFFGSTILRTFIDDLSRPAWLVVTAVLGVGILILARSAGRRAAPPRRPTSEVARPSRGSVASGARLVFGSSYLTAIAVMVGVYEIASTIVDFQFTSAVRNELSGPAIARHISSVYAVTNAVSFGVQLFLTSFVLTRHGPGVALLILPSVLLLGAGGFVVAPTLALGSLLSVADNGLSYSIHQSAKESLYVPATTDEKYRAKAFIDMFVQRFAKVLAVGVSLAVTSVVTDGDDMRWLMLLLIPLLAVWAIAARHAGRGFEIRERGREEARLERRRVADGLASLRV